MNTIKALHYLRKYSIISLINQCLLKCIYNESGFLTKVQKAEIEEFSNALLFKIPLAEEKSDIMIWYKSMLPVCNRLKTKNGR